MAGERALRVAIATARIDGSAIVHYGIRLTEALRDAGADAEHVAHGDWGPRGIRDILRRLREGRYDVVHYQWPGASFGKRGGIQLVTLAHPGIVSLHEASTIGPVRGRLQLLPFTLRSRALLFMTEYERAYMERWAPWVRRKSAVIPIGSNIPPRERVTEPIREVVYFGHVRPNKGIEAFIDLAHRWDAEGDPTPFRIIGAATPPFAAYARRVLQAPLPSNVTWVGDLDDDGELAERLRQAAVAYLPFPDGLSAKRGSFLALAGCGVPVVTTRGHRTVDGLEHVALFASTPEATTAALRRILDDPGAAAPVAARARAYAAQFGWPAIARRHISLYRRVLARSTA